MEPHSGEFRGLSYAILRIRSHFPSLPPFPNTLSFPPSKVHDLPAKSTTSFLVASVARRLFLLQNRSRGCECGYTQKDARPAVGGRGNDSSRGSQLNQPSHPETILSPWSLQKLCAAVGGRGGPSTPVTPPRLLPMGALRGHPYTSLRPAILPTYPQCSGVHGAPGWPEKGRG